MKSDPTLPPSIQQRLAGTKERVAAVATQHQLQDVFAYELFHLGRTAEYALRLNSPVFAREVFAYESRLTERIRAQAQVLENSPGPQERETT